MGNNISPLADLVLYCFDDTTADLLTMRDNMQIYQCGLGICKYVRRLVKRRLHLLGMKWLAKCGCTPDIFEARNARFTYILLFRHETMDAIRKISGVGRCICCGHYSIDGNHMNKLGESSCVGNCVTWCYQCKLYSAKRVDKYNSAMANCQYCGEYNLFEYKAIYG